MFIVGRAIAGIGGAGLFTGGVMILRDSVPLSTMPLYIGILGMVFGTSSIAGPLLGGAFTGKFPLHHEELARCLYRLLTHLCRESKTYLEMVFLHQLATGTCHITSHTAPFRTETKDAKFPLDWKLVETT